MKKVALLAAALCLAGVAHANPNSTPFTKYSFSSQDPQQSENFYCQVDNAADTDEVSGLNHAELITGFNSNGELLSTVKDINNFYFKANHDPEQQGKQAYVILMVNSDNDNADINCFTGDGGRKVYNPVGSRPHVVR